MPDILTERDCADESPPVLYPPAEERITRVGINRRADNLNDFELTEIERLQSQLEAARVELERVYEGTPAIFQERLDKLREILNT